MPDPLTSARRRRRGASLDAPDPLRPLRASVLAWYGAQGRDLAFRATGDPWAILVSEAMAQQTQAARAADAWRGFIVAYPTPAALAVAPPADVVRAWRGLGYNRRAVLLQRAARAIVDRHGGAVPSDLDSLEALPGVGPYTSRAVAALAFGVPVGAVDTNVRRVLTRLVAAPHARVPGPAEGRRGAASRSLPSPSALQRLADRLVDAADPGRWTHAVMDVGATHCRPARPRCEGCPASAWCGTAGGPLAPTTWRHILTPSAPSAPSAESGSRRTAATLPAIVEPRPREAAFHTTSRWLRGRIVDRLRDAPGDDWVRFGDPIGDHGPSAVREAIVRLVRDGLAEMHPDDPVAARLPTDSAIDRG